MMFDPAATAMCCLPSNTYVIGEAFHVWLVGNDQSGWPLVHKDKRTWDVGGLSIRGYEYHFEQGSLGQPRRTCVYNFFIVPGKGVVPDERDVREATGDYMRRDYGAAQ
jgi:hypothetical protein